MRLTRLAFACATLAAGPAFADPAVIFDMGGKFDKSFNQAGYEGSDPPERPAITESPSTASAK